MRQFFIKRWFLISLAVLIGGGLTIGGTFGKEVADALKLIAPPRLVTGIVLFLMAFSLDSTQLKASFKSPGPVGWAFLVNFGVIPLMGWGLMTAQQTPDFAFGLMIAASAPCTMAAASVWTRKAGGNDAVSLLVTVSTNGLCFVITPFWLNLTTTGDVRLDFWEMFWRLVSAVLIPTLLGQLTRRIPAAERFAVKNKTPLGVIAQSCILVIVFSAAAGAGVQLTKGGPTPAITGIALVWGSCIAIHLAAMAITYFGGKAIGFAKADLPAVAFSGSQKTLPIGVLLASDPTMFGNPDLLGPGIGVPFAVFPMLMFHASQLFIDTAIADRFAAANASAEQSPPLASGETTAK